MPTATEKLTEAYIKRMIDEAIEASKHDKYLPIKEQMRAELLALPPQTERKFEKDIVKYALKWDDSVILNKDGKTALLYEFIDLIKQEAPSEEDRRLAFAAFCIAENYARRNENLTSLTALEKNYGHYFKDEPFLLHLEVCTLIKKLEAYKKEEWENTDFSIVLQKALTNMQNLTGNIGGAHAYAELILLAFENAPELLNYLNDKKKEKLLTMNHLHLLHSRLQLTHLLVSSATSVYTPVQ